MGPVPPVRPWRNIAWPTFGADFGALGSCWMVNTLSPRSSHPSSTLALNGRSETGWYPAGSPGLDPGACVAKALTVSGVWPLVAATRTWVPLDGPSFQVARTSPFWSVVVVAAGRVPP